MNSKGVFSQENWQEVFNYALSLCGNWHDAEDIVQEAFAIIYDRESEAPGKVKKPIAYAKGIIRHLISQRNKVVAKQSYVVLEKVVNLSANPLDLLIAKESRILKRRVVNAIERLIAERIKDNGPKGRRARMAQLHYKEGLSAVESASQLGIPEGTGKSDLFRFRDDCRELSEGADYINYRNP